MNQKKEEKNKKEEIEENKDANKKTTVLSLDEIDAQMHELAEKLQRYHIHLAS